MRHHRQLRLILGNDMVQSLTSKNILIVGAGGIGCEFVKNLSKSAIKRFTLVDFDHIEETNLNRTFYFRSEHTNQSKSQTLRLSLLKFDSSLEIIAIDASIYDSRFTCSFYEVFDCFISALDNRKAREHLAKMATKYGKPLIDAGTMGYYGQIYPTVRGITACHNCYASQGQSQSYAVCTIRNSPETPQHCAAYARNIYDSFFGLQSQKNTDKYLIKPFKDLAKVGIQVFNDLFSTNISTLFPNTCLARKITYEDALTKCEPLLNNYSRFGQTDSQSIYLEERIWSLANYAINFVQSFCSLAQRRLELQNSPLPFLKDDDASLLFVCCIMNLRAYNYMLCSSLHRYMNLYQCKDMIGKIIPAIASTNAIVAALQIREMLNCLQERYDSFRRINVINDGPQRLSPTECQIGNPNCDYCSDKVIYAQFYCDLQKRTYRELQQFTQKQLLTYGRTIRNGEKIVIKNDNSNGVQSPNKDKKLNFNSKLVEHDGTISLSFDPIIGRTPFIVHLVLRHKEIIGFQPGNMVSKDQLRKQLMRYCQNQQTLVCEQKKSVYKSYGPGSY